MFSFFYCSFLLTVQCSISKNEFFKLWDLHWVKKYYPIFVIYNLLHSTHYQLSWNVRQIIILAIYWRHDVHICVIKTGQFDYLFRFPDNKFLTVGDYYAKHIYWSSRLMNPNFKVLWLSLIERRNDRSSPQQYLERIEVRSKRYSFVYPYRTK